MRPSPISLAAAMTSAFVAAPAGAAQEAASSPKLAFEIGAVSDYRYRGVSLSGGEPAIQAEALLEFEAGFWASAWGSTLSGDDVELQLAAGYSTDIFSRLNLEVSLNYYAYPSDGSSNYLEGAITLARPFGNFTPKIGLEYAPPQAHLRDDQGRKRDNLYAFVGVDLKLGGTPLTLGGAVGYETGIFDTRERGGKWDWRLGATAETKWLNFDLTYVNSNGRMRSSRGRDLANETLVASIAKSF